MFLQNASFFAKCKLHLARFAVDQTADAVGKRSGFRSEERRVGKECRL